MVVDTSVLVSILLEEPESVKLGLLITEADAVIAAPNLVEAYMVLSKHFGARTRERVLEALGRLGISVIPFSEDHFEWACSAFDRFGKGRHPAALNFGDCFAYALAKSSGQPLLFLGGDFALTDIKPAI